MQGCPIVPPLRCVHWGTLPACGVLAVGPCTPGRRLDIQCTGKQPPRLPTSKGPFLSLLFALFFGFTRLQSMRACDVPVAPSIICFLGFSWGFNPVPLAPCSTLNKRDPPGDGPRPRPSARPPQAFVACVAAVRQQGQASVPSFDHGVGDPRPDDIRITPQHTCALPRGGCLLCLLCLLCLQRPPGWLGACVPSDGALGFRVFRVLCFFPRPHRP